MSTWAARLDNPISARLRDPATTGFLGILLGAFAAFLAIPPIEARTVTWPILVGIVAAAARDLDGHPRPPPARLGRSGGRHARDRPRHPRHPLEHLEPRLHVRRDARGADARLRDAARLRGDRRHLLRAERRREHRPRGDDADGRLLGRLRRRQGRQLGRRAPRRHGCRRPAGARLRLLRDPSASRPDRGRDGESTSSPSG